MRRAVAIPLNAGLDEGDNPQVERQGLLQADNVEWTGKTTVESRTGTLLQDGTAITVCNEPETVTTYKDRPVVIGERLAVLDDGDLQNAGSDVWVVGQTKITEEPMLTVPGRKIVACDMVDGDKHLVIAYTWKDGSNYKTVVASFAKESRAKVDERQLVSSTVCRPARLCVTGEGDLLHFHVNTSNAVRVGQISDADGTVAADSASLLSPIHTTKPDVDVEAYDLDVAGRVFVVALQSSGQVAFGWYSGWNGSSFTSGSSNSMGTGNDGVCCFRYSTSCVIVAWLDGADVYVKGINPSDGSQAIAQANCIGYIGSTAERIAGVGNLTNTEIFVCVDNYQNTHPSAYPDENQVIKIHWPVSGGSFGAKDVQTKHGYAMDAQPIVDERNNLLTGTAGAGRNMFVPVSTHRTGALSQRTGALLWLNAAEFGGYAVQRAYSSFLEMGNFRNHIPHWQRLSANRWAISVLETASFDDTVTSVLRVEIDRGLSSHRTHETEQVLEIAAATPAEFDGRSVTPMAFMLPGAIFELSQSGASGNNLTHSAYYSYVAVYEFWDTSGRRRFSAPSEMVTFQNDNTKDPPVIEFYDYPFARLGTSCRIAVYRTLANQNVFYRLGDQANDNTVTWADNVADTALVDNEVLYSLQAGGLAADPIPGHYVSTTGFGRYLFVPQDRTATVVRYSLPIIRGEGLICPNTLEIQIPAEGGDIVALHCLHDRLIVFKENRIYATHPRAPGPLGVDLLWQEPYLVDLGVGCGEQMSVIRTPGGVMFWSGNQRRIYGVTSELGVIAVEAVRWQAEQYDVRWAAYDPARRSVYFATNDGPLLVLHTGYGTWATWSGDYNDCRAIAAAGGLLYFMKQSSGLAVEDPTTFYDDGYANANVVATVTLPWLTPGGMFGFGNVPEMLILGYATLVGKTITVDWQYDFAPAWLDADSILTTVLGVYFGEDAHFGAGSSSYAEKAALLRCPTADPRRTAYRPRISWEAGGVALTAVALVVQPDEQQTALADETRRM